MPQKNARSPQCPRGKAEGQRFPSGLLRVERRRVELPTSSLRTNNSTDETTTKQGDSAPLSENAHDCADESPPNTPVSLARLLAELAALPADQRAAIAALLAPQTPATPTPQTPAPDRLDDGLPWERKQKEGDTT